MQVRIVLVVCLLSLIFVSCSKNSLNKWQKYSNEKGFSFYYPKQWEIVEKELGFNKEILHVTAVNEGESGFSIVVVENPGYSKKQIEEFALGMSKKSKYVRNINKEWLEIDKNSFFRLQYWDYEESSKADVAFAGIYGVVKGHLFTITFLSCIENQKEATEIFNKLINSFEFYIHDTLTP